jgi:hypothetical protein
MKTWPTPDPVQRLVEAGCLPDDPLGWIADSSEPYAMVVALRDVLGRDSRDSELIQTRAQVLEHDAVRKLIDELPPRVTPTSADHHSPLFLPNRLNLLADMGVRYGDFDRVDGLLEKLIDSQARTGRFTPRTGSPSGHTNVSPRCEHNAVTEVLLRFGFGADERVARGVARVMSDLSVGAQGRGWCCVPEQRSLRSRLAKLDVCPQIDLEGLRTAGLLGSRSASAVTDAARTPLELWRRRSDERPYRFGHGYQFKTVRWPSFWYDVLRVVDTVGRFPELWSGPDSREDDRMAIAELAACLIAYNMDSDGRVTPRRVHRGYEAFSFGAKDAPSAFATAQVLAALVRVADLAELISRVDVGSLASSKGSADTPMPPGPAPQNGAVCRAPAIPVFDPDRVLARILTRHHLTGTWEPHNAESIVADVVGLTATHPSMPYHSLAARMSGYDESALLKALDKRRSLARWRCMRGLLMVVRCDFVPIVHAATSRQVVKRARDFARSKGVTPEAYRRWAPRVLDACSETPLTTRGLRSLLRPDVDVGALLTLMAAEGVVARAGAEPGSDGRRLLFAPTGLVYPELDLAHPTEDEARAQLLRAYVRGYGPVTRRDAAWWTGMDLKRVERSMAALEDELLEISLKGNEGTWLMHAADADELERATFLERPSVVALPPNDPLMLGYADRSRFLDDVARPYVFDSANNAAPVVLVDGRIAAVWSVVDEPAADTAEPMRVAMFPVAPLSAEAAALAPQAIAQTLGTSRPVGISMLMGMVPLLDRPVGTFMHPVRHES